jgi:cysteine desulfurase
VALSVKRIYLDHNATTPLRAEALRRWNEVAERHYGNPSSVHASGRAARAILDEAREECAAALRVKEDEISYTGGGTEALQLALYGAVWARQAHAGGAPRGLVVSAIEHAAVLGVANRLAAQGVPVAYVPVDALGRIAPEAVVEAARSVHAGVVAIQTANNEIGTIQPISAIRTALDTAYGHERPWLVTDAVQTAGRVPLELARCGADIAVLSAHKFGGPSGVGLLWVKAGTRLVPMADGEGQEYGLRPGTEAVAAIAATATALRLAVAEQPVVAAQMASNCRLLWSLLTAQVPGVQLNGPPLDAPDRLPNTLNLSVPGTDGRTLVARLDLEGLETSAGSACASGSLEPSHVLLACGHARDAARAALRLSLGRDTRSEDVHMAVDILRRTFSSRR